jgi:hypothetical protein
LGLRSFLGSEAIQGTRTHIRFSSTFGVFLEAPTDPHAEFMPGHEGRWFDEKRRTGPLAPMPEAPQQVLTHFLEFLKWCSLNDPRGMHTILRSSPYLVRGLDYADLLRLLGSTRPDPLTTGWSAYWRATAETDLEFCIRLLRMALDEASRDRDYQLASVVCLELGKALNRTGRVTEALKVVDYADHIAAKSQTLRTKIDAARLRGTVEVQLRQSQSGFDSLLRAQDLADTRVEWINVQALRAYFLAVSDRLEEATVLLAAPLRFVNETGHSSTSILCGMTGSILALGGGRPADTVPQLIAYSADVYSRGSIQFGVYADELLARLYRKIGDRESATARIESARLGRSQAHMAVTPLEARPLRVLD